ncbi:MAG: cupin domain-containing protein [Methanophagales archaeon]|nr:cupin domain-containing protein [Methanophagales archaeon]
MRIVRKESKSPFVAKDGSEIRELYKSERMSLAEATVYQETKNHFHKTSEEIYYILEGKGIMEIGGEPKEISEGDVAVILPEEKHRISTTKKVRFLCFCSPPYSDEDTVLE